MSREVYEDLTALFFLWYNKPTSTSQCLSKSCKNKELHKRVSAVCFAASVKGWILHHCLSVGLLLQASLSAAVLLKDRGEEGMERALMPAF